MKRRKEKEKEEQELLQRLEKQDEITKADFKQLLFLSKSHNEVTRSDVADILIDVNNMAAKKLLLRLARDKNELVRTCAYDSLHVFPFPDVEELLRKSIMKEKDELACSYAIMAWSKNALKLYEKETSILFIRKLLHTSRIQKWERCRIMCYLALYDWGEEKAIKNLLSFANSDIPNNRYLIYDIMDELEGDENKNMIIQKVEERLIEEEFKEYRRKLMGIWKKLRNTEA